MLLLNRKAYTLSQFILVWVLGILFVILICLTVFRYRATAHAKQAEAFMQEVRAEQEDRCAVGRKYAVYHKHLKAFAKRNKGTEYMRYDLSSGQGITAHHKLINFKLQMPSYADGRVCCDDCEKLDRYYSPCDVLTKRKDFVAADPACTVYVSSKYYVGPKKTKERPTSDKIEATTQPTEKKMTAENNPASEPVPVTAEEAAAQPGQTQEGQAQQTSSAADTPAEVSTQPQETEASVDTPPVKKPKAAAKCKIPAQGEFFIDGCEVYQADARGSVVHTWNFDTCSYEVTQTCMVPAKWKRMTDTKEEKGLYPSDLDDYCVEWMNKAPCAANVAAGRECGTVDEICNKDCQITDKTEVKESALIILYDVKVKTEQLRCIPSKEVTVKVP